MPLLAPPDEAGNLLLHPGIARHLSHSHYATLRAVYWYEQPARALIHLLKYRHRFALADWLSSRFATVYPSLSPPRPAMLLPVPMTYRRYWQRQYNQAAELARGLSQHYQTPWYGQWAMRVANTSQQQLDKQARGANARLAYRLQHGAHCWRQAPPARVVIVDDVITTGATVDALAGCVHRHWPRTHIEVWVMAVTPAPGERR